ncbi:hypothetical protein [Moraxella lacunata]|uniref:hypothetical protein n=1 Tax=Moraxella lacunata TaxID=477 RepID=UPI003EE2A3E4
MAMTQKIPNVSKRCVVKVISLLKKAINCNLNISQYPSYATIKPATLLAFYFHS